MGNVRRRRDNHKATQPGENIRHLGEKQKAEQSSPDKAGEIDRLQGADIGETQGPHQGVMSNA